MKKRDTLATRIRRQQTIQGKLSEAIGRTAFYSFWSNPTTKPDIVSFLAHAEALGLMMDKKRLSPDEILGRTSTLGIRILAEIADGNSKFFHQLAGLIQGGKKPSPHKRYRDILLFCFWNGCGTEEKPCGLELTEFMEKRGHRFHHAYDKEIPAVLRVMCKRIGVFVSLRKSK